MLGDLMRYNQFSISKNNPLSDHMNNGAFLAADNFDFDYMFTVDDNCLFTHENVFNSRSTHPKCVFFLSIWLPSRALNPKKNPRVLWLGASRRGIRTYGNTGNQ